MNTVERIRVPMLDPGRISEVRTKDLRSLGECPSAIDHLLEHALYAEPLGISSERYLAVVPKIRPYATLDAMIVAADEHHVIPSITALSTEELQQQYTLALRMFYAYETDASTYNNPLTVKALAVNYDTWPSDADLTPKAAQSIPTEHMHVFAYTLHEAQETEVISASLLSKKEQRRYFDPMNAYISSLFHLTSIRNAMSRGLSSVTIGEYSTYNGVTFTYDGALDTLQFARDMQQIHKNGEALFINISGFLHPETTNAYGQPILKSQEQRLDALQYFLESFPAITPEEENIHRGIEARSRYMMTQLKAPHMERVQSVNKFHEEYAYTLLVSQRVGDPLWYVTLSPRVISDGNALATLHQYRVPSQEPVSEDYYKHVTIFHNSMRKSLLRRER